MRQAHPRAGQARGGAGSEHSARHARRRPLGHRPDDRGARATPPRLEACPDGLAELRGVLVREHEWRVRDGLVLRAGGTIYKETERSYDQPWGREAGGIAGGDTGASAP